MFRAFIVSSVMISCTQAGIYIIFPTILQLFHSQTLFFSITPYPSLRLLFFFSLSHTYTPCIPTNTPPHAHTTIFIHTHTHMHKLTLSISLYLTLHLFCLRLFHSHVKARQTGRMAVDCFSTSLHRPRPRILTSPLEKVAVPLSIHGQYIPNGHPAASSENHNST